MQTGADPALGSSKWLGDIMGMATIETPKPPKPRYNWTVVCPQCWAEYSPGKWVRGFDANGRHSTAPMDFVPVIKVPDDACPNCLSPNVKVSEAADET
jgi:hypothetical protein